MKVTILATRNSRDLENEVNLALANPPSGHFLQELQFHPRSYMDGHSYVMIVWGEIPNTE